jgi:hypothetical protein
LFSITIVNTEPVHGDGGAAVVVVSEAHCSFVLPESLGLQPTATASVTTVTAKYFIAAQRAVTSHSWQARIIARKSLILRVRTCSLAALLEHG